MHCYYWLTDDKFNSNKAKKSTPNDQLVKLNQRTQWIFTYWANVYRGVGYRLELDTCRANAVAKTTVLRGIGLLSLTQGLANCIFILIDLVLNHVFGPKNVQFQGQRYANHLLSDPDQFIYYTHLFMRQCRSDITILMHLSIWFMQIF